MPTNRTPMRRSRRSSITPEIVAMFVELDRTPVRLRRHQDFKDQEHELMRRLDLVSEFWTMNSVLDATRRPCHPEGYAAHTDWHTCRRVREQLLEAARLQ